MKNVLFLSIIVFFGFTACRNTDEPVQQIDQIINLYIDSLGQDLLNSSIEGSYLTISMNDVYGLTDNAPVTFSNIKDADTVNYIEYLASAKRRGIDSVGDFKTYESKIDVFITKKKNDTANVIFNDSLRIQYTSTPNLFQVSKIWYNGSLEFTKIEGQPNIVRIQK